MVDAQGAFDLPFQFIVSQLLLHNVDLKFAVAHRVVSPTLLSVRKVHPHLRLKIRPTVNVLNDFVHLGFYMMYNI